MTGKGASTAYVSFRGKTMSTSPMAGNETTSWSDAAAKTESPRLISVGWMNRILL